VGYGGITQTITIPALADLANPTLTFWYRVYSYDVVLGTDGITLFDSFDVHLLSPQGAELALVVRDGDYSSWPKNIPLGDTGWKQASYSLAPFAGQTIQVQFQCWSRNDNILYKDQLSYFNTYAYLDEVLLTGELPGRPIHLPVILRNW
jgi:hypothetical protein